MGDTRKSFSDSEYIVSHLVDSTQDGMRLDNFMMLHVGTLSRQFIKSKIAKGEITISGRDACHRPSTKVKDGDRVTMITYAKNLEDEFWQGELIPQEQPDLIYQDEDLLALGKPAFMATHPTGFHLFYCATIEAEKIAGTKVYGVHRLDRETSGIIMFAKNMKTASFLTEQFENKIIRKAYFFIAKLKENALPEFPISANERIGHDPITNYRLINKTFPEDSKYGKSAKTDFLFLDQFENYVFALAFPYTGRQHQIRVHAKHHGLPLLGDKIYWGGKDVFGRFKDVEPTQEDYENIEIPRQALHATAINLIHQGKRKTLKAPLPKDLIHWIKTNTEINCEKLTKKINSEIDNVFNNLSLNS